MHAMADANGKRTNDSTYCWLAQSTFTHAHTEAAVSEKDSMNRRESA